MKIVALIPLRGGSKSIPYKNIKMIAGKPLCQWTIEAAIASDMIDEVYVSTEDDKIKQVVKSINDDIHIINRPGKFAGDTSSTEDVMLHFAEEVDFDLLVTIQATSPLTTSRDLDGGIAELIAKQGDSLVTTVTWKRFFWSEKNKPVNYTPEQRPRRQDFEPWYMETGNFYITKRDILTETKCRLGGKIIKYILPSENYIEIDEPSDWEYIEYMLKNRRVKKNSDIIKNIKLFILDVDGVLTDAGMYYNDTGEALKRFSTRDGHGLSMLKQNGIKRAIISSENSLITKARAEKLEIDYIYINIKDKLSILNEIVEKEGLTYPEIAYIGDDIFDIPVLKKVGFSAAPNDAQEEVKEVVDYICEKKGGYGCVREITDLILSVYK